MNTVRLTTKELLSSREVAIHVSSWSICNLASVLSWVLMISGETFERPWSIYPSSRLIWKLSGFFRNWKALATLLICVVEINDHAISNVALSLGASFSLYILDG